MITNKIDYLDKEYVLLYIRRLYQTWINILIRLIIRLKPTKKIKINIIYIYNILYIMDINIQDEHYKKYIKYKTKYLELKEQSGRGLFRNPEVYEKIQSGGESKSFMEQIFDFLFSQEGKIYDTYYLSLNDSKSRLANTPDSDKIDKIDKAIFGIESIVSQFILPRLYVYPNIDKNKIIQIYKVFCQNIDEYRNHLKLDVMTQNNTKTNIINNNNNHKKQLLGYLDNIRLPLLKETIELYYSKLNERIEKNVKFTIELNICESNQLYIDYTLKNRLKTYWANTLSGKKPLSTWEETLKTILADRTDVLWDKEWKNTLKATSGVEWENTLKDYFSSQNTSPEAKLFYAVYKT
jgi:hypothetical protein